MTTATFEVTSGIVRVHLNGGVWGDPFDLAVTVTGDEGVALIKALAAPVSTAVRKAIFAALRQVGFHTVTWRRHLPDGTVRDIRHPLVPRQ
jgi:hypothetical protein